MITKEGGDWLARWSGPNWLKAPKVRQLAAVEMGNQRGASIWALTDDYKVIYNYQTSPGTNSWWGWSPGDFEDKLTGYEITACGQNNGLARVWVVSLSQMLTTQGMDASSKDWERFWTPPA